MTTVQEFRSFYAEFIVGSAGSSNQRLIDAFAATEREHYVGAGPWQIAIGSTYLQTPSDDPRWLYQDVLVGLAVDRRLNNGQPTLHARCLDACAPAEGESVVHIGAGTGYYTAVLAYLVGARGQVVGYEIEEDLAARAQANLQHLHNVQVRAASASEEELPKADVVYVNAGATHPLAAWLDALNVGGRLIFPLTPAKGFGGMLMVTRLDATRYAASFVLKVAFTPCIGARDDVAAQTLATAFETRPTTQVRSLRRDHAPDATAWCVGDGWWLSSAAP